MIAVKALDLRALVFMTPKIMRETAGYLLAAMKARIQSGRGSSGAQMKPYTPEYAKHRAEAGRNTSPRDLTFTGRMLNARGVKRVEQKTAVIGWAGGEEALKALGNERRTPFVKATEEERRAAVTFLKGKLKQHINSELARLRAKKR